MTQSTNGPADRVQRALDVLRVWRDERQIGPEAARLLYEVGAALTDEAPPAPPNDRAAVLREAADALAAKRQVYGAPGANLQRRSPLRVQGMADAEAELRRMAAEAEPASVHQPHRGDRFEAWLKGQRDISASWSVWRELNSLLDQYRLHADTGTPLGEHVCEGQAVGDCGCLERPDTAGGTENPAALLRRAAAYVRERAAVVLPGVGVGAALADWLEQAADALEGQDVPEDEPAVRLARALLAGEAAR